MYLSIVYLFTREYPDGKRLKTFSLTGFREIAVKPSSQHQIHAAGGRRTTKAGEDWAPRPHPPPARRDRANTLHVSLLRLDLGRR